MLITVLRRRRRKKITIPAAVRAGIRWHDFVRNSGVSLRTGLAHVSDRIITIRDRDAIFGHVARLPVNTQAPRPCYAKSSYRLVDRQTLHGNVHQVDPVPNGPTNSAAITTMFPLRLCGGKLLVAVTRERRYGPSRLRVNDYDDDVLAVEYGNCSRRDIWRMQ